MLATIETRDPSMDGIIHMLKKQILKMSTFAAATISNIKITKRLEQ